MDNFFFEYLNVENSPYSLLSHITSLRNSWKSYNRSRMHLKYWFYEYVPVPNNLY